VNSRTAHEVAFISDARRQHARRYGRLFGQVVEDHDINRKFERSEALDRRAAGTAGAAPAAA
jgi:hypothetical protein